PVFSVQLTNGSSQLLVTPVLDGSSKVFRCDTSPNGSRPRALFNWYKRSENQSPILIQDQSVSTPSPTPDVNLSMVISYSTLALMGNRSYQNMYIYCEARDETNRGNFLKSTEAQINIVYGPTISLIDYTEVEEGENVSIACKVTANPQPDIVWSRNGTVISPSSDTLRIPNILRLNDGNYTCTASNVLYPTWQAPIYQIATDTIMIRVLYGPGSSIYLTPNYSLYHVDEGNKAVDIICSATCNPVCSYRWIKGNAQLSSSNTLSLGIIQKNKTGNYICEAFNTIRGQMKGSNRSLEVIVR
ncbi:hypothetical protein ACJMK2_008741, partial [Sinanodonta woodiana]